MSDAAILAAITATAGIGGVAIGGWIAIQGQRRERRHQRLRQQIDEFYGPMVGMREQIKARSELARDINILHEKERAGGESERRDKFGHLEDREAAAARLRDFERAIDYDNAQMKDVLLPLYTRMSEHFTSHMSLAEPSTRKHFAQLVRYIETWERHYEKAFPGNTLQTISDRYEQKLHPLYDDLEEQLTRLTKEVKEQSE